MKAHAGRELTMPRQLFEQQYLRRLIPQKRLTKKQRHVHDQNAHARIVSSKNVQAQHEAPRLIPGETHPATAARQVAVV